MRMFRWIQLVALGMALTTIIIVARDRLRTERRCVTHGTVIVSCEVRR